MRRNGGKDHRHGKTWTSATEKESMVNREICIEMGFMEKMGAHIQRPHWDDLIVKDIWLVLDQCFLTKLPFYPNSIPLFYKHFNVL